MLLSLVCSSLSKVITLLNNSTRLVRMAVIVKSWNYYREVPLLIVNTTGELMREGLHYMHPAVAIIPSQLNTSSNGEQVSPLLLSGERHHYMLAITRRAVLDYYWNIIVLQVGK